MENGNKNIRLIEPCEINAYVKQVITNNKGEHKGLILLYKDSRYDMAVLDEIYGPMGWQVSYSEVKGSLYCTIGVFDPQRSQWVEKTSNGMESDIEAQKGEASDAFKRAGFLWGIGRELYTTPLIFVDLTAEEVYAGKDGKMKLKPSVVFSVKEIGYDEKRSISMITITDRRGIQRFHWEAGRVSKPTQPPVQPPAPQPTVQMPPFEIPDSKDQLALMLEGLGADLRKVFVAYKKSSLEEMTVEDLKQAYIRKYNAMNKSTKEVQ